MFSPTVWASSHKNELATVTAECHLPVRDIEPWAPTVTSSLQLDSQSLSRKTTTLECLLAGQQLTLTGINTPPVSSTPVQDRHNTVPVQSENVAMSYTGSDMLHPSQKFLNWQRCSGLLKLNITEAELWKEILQAPCSQNPSLCAELCLLQKLRRGSSTALQTPIPTVPLGKSVILTLLTWVLRIWGHVENISTMGHNWKSSNLELAVPLFIQNQEASRHREESPHGGE